MISCFALGQDWSGEQGSDQLWPLDSCHQREVTYSTLSRDWKARRAAKPWRARWLQKWANAQSRFNCSCWDLVSTLINLDCAPGTGTWEAGHGHSLDELTPEGTSLWEPSCHHGPPWNQELLEYFNSHVGCFNFFFRSYQPSIHHVLSRV